MKDRRRIPARPARLSQRRGGRRRRSRDRHSAGCAGAAARSRRTGCGPRRPGYAFLNLDEAAFVEALVDHMVPADELTPKGTDIGINIYIDRALAGGWGKGDRLYMQGPWKQRRAEPGLPAAAHARAALSRRHRGDQRALPQDLRQDRSTRSTENAARGGAGRAVAAGKITFDSGPPARVFWTTLYQTVMEGMFSDPIYGGNRNKAGWKLIGFPGVIAVHRENIEKYRGQEIHRRIRRHRGHELREGDMATKLKEVDVVIVGLGWTGGILAKELTEAGLKVVALERGAHAHAPTRTSRCRTSATSCATCVRHDLMQNTARDTLTIRNNPSQEALPMRRLGSFLPGEGVGGSGVHWSGHTWRWTDMEFKVRSHVRGALRQELHSRRHDDPGLGHHLRRARAVLRQVRIHRRRSPARPATSRARSSPAAIRSRRRARANIRCRR